MRHGVGLLAAGDVCRLGSADWGLLLRLLSDPGSVMTLPQRLIQCWDISIGISIFKNLGYRDTSLVAAELALVKVEMSTGGSGLRFHKYLKKV